MTALPLFLLLAGQSGAALPSQARYEACVSRAEDDPAAGERDATHWRIEGGGYFARQCEGLAIAAQRRWPSAAAAFQEAAHDAELAHDRRSATYWSQAGNAWLAAGEPAKARAALDAALASGELDGLALGEARLDRARALVAAGDLAGARGDIDSALISAKDDPLAWLLSATLARRAGDLTRAQHDIIEALRRAPDDASVELERGNIAAARGDADGAQAGWRQAVKVQPSSAAAASATQALAQFDTGPVGTKPTEGR
ncbi:MAG: tetratricopeptide repeat protein [Janthinobacterium lividum]